MDGWFFIGILGSAILNTLAHLSATQALKEGDVSLVAPLFLFSPVVTFLVSSFMLREVPQLLPLIGVGLIIIGAIVAIRAIWQGETRIDPVYWRPMVFVLGSILVFAFLIPRGGLVLSTLLVTILSSFGTRETRWRNTIGLGILMALSTALVFIKLLGLSISVWPK